MARRLDPRRLAPDMKALWDGLVPALERRGVPFDRRTALTAAACYGFFQRCRAKLPTAPPHHVEQLRELGEEMRQAARRALAALGVIDSARVAAAPLDAAGNDAELAEWFVSDQVLGRGRGSLGSGGGNRAARSGLRRRRSRHDDRERRR